MSKAHHRILNYFKADVLADRVALITGGGSGIGFEISQQFGVHGVKGVVIMGRRQQFLEDAAKMLTTAGVTTAIWQGDVRKPEDCRRAVKTAIDSFGALDILVNCAAGNFLAVSEQLSPNAFKTVMDIDTMGCFNMMHSAFEPLKNSRFGGVIISITATLHYTATWWQTAPVAAKAAIDTMTRNLALEWGEYGIRCNTIAPGPVEDTPGLQKLSGGNTTMPFPTVPTRRASTKAEIASSAIYLCLNEAITGHSLVVDGGEWFGKQAYMPREMVAEISKKVEKSSRDMGPGASKL